MNHKGILLLTTWIARSKLANVASYALSVVVVVSAAVATLAEHHHLSSATLRVESLQARLPRAATGTPVQGSTVPADAAQFQAILQAADSRTDTVRKLFMLADAASLTLDQGSYKTALSENAGFHTFEVTLPLKGDYPAVRDFCKSVLLKYENAALDELSIKKDLAAAAQADVLVKFRFYLPATDVASASRAPVHLLAGASMGMKVEQVRQRQP